MPVQSDSTRTQVLSRLKIAITKELNELMQAYQHRPMSAVAWTARNLLELLIWTEYCSESEENAEIFANDCARDAVDAIDLPAGFAIDEQFSHRDARAAIIKKTKDAGFDSIDESYTRVSSAAKSVGLGEEFKYSNKLFSKFAHPTALMVMTPMDEFEQSFRAKFLDGGQRCAEQALARIERFLG